MFMIDGTGTQASYNSRPASGATNLCGRNCRMDEKSGRKNKYENIDGSLCHIF